MKHVQATTLYNPFTEKYGMPDFVAGVILESDVPRIIKEASASMEELKDKFPALNFGNYELIPITVTHE
jgi:hypothetical protein